MYKTSLTVAGIVGAMMLTSVASFAAQPRANMILAQDDWVQLPSSGDRPDSESSTPATSRNNQPAADHPQRGSDNAALTIVEYSDFQCPYCRAVEASLRQVMKKYGDQVRLVYMDFPLPFHQHAMDAAIAARCADEQGQFWTYHDALIENPSTLSTPGLKNTAEQLGLDSMTFDRCLDGRKYESSVVADRTQGERIGAHGTPYFIVGNRSMSGAQPASAFESAIDQQLHSQ